MPNVALIPGAGTQIAALAAVVDGYPEASHKLATTTGGEPLEDGRAVTDHVVARQEELELTGWVSDFNGGDRPHDAWEALRRLHRDAEPVAVLTEWGSYPEMIIREAQARQVGRGMRFTLKLEQIIRVGVTDADLPSGQLSGPASGRSGQVNRGRVSLLPV